MVGPARGPHLQWIGRDVGPDRRRKFPRRVTLTDGCDGRPVTRQRFPGLPSRHISCRPIGPGAEPLMTVQPFVVNVPPHTLDDLRERLARTRWLHGPPDAGWERGTSAAYLKELVEYWHTTFDWRAQEARINRFAHFHADPDGVGIHFIHERGRGTRPLPIALTHGYPDSHRHRAPGPQPLGLGARYPLHGRAVLAPVPETDRPLRSGEDLSRRGGSVAAEGGRVRVHPGHATADAGARTERLAGARGLDRGEVSRLERPTATSRPASPRTSSWPTSRCTGSPGRSARHSSPTMISRARDR